MIIQCQSQKNVEELLKYIGNDYKQTPYFYVNLKKYGISSSNVTIWVDQGTSNINGIYLLYYDCLHFFTKYPDSYPCESILTLVEKIKPKVIMVQGSFGKRLEIFIKGSYIIERNHIIDMDSIMNINSENQSEIATSADLEEITDLLLSDIEYTQVYSRDTLSAQLTERFYDHFSRYFIIKHNQKVIATCSTYGEVDDFALIGGVMVHNNYRRKGYASDVENFACQQLTEEGKSKVGFVNYHNVASLELHKKLGAFPIASLYKFIRINKDRV